MQGHAGQKNEMSGEGKEMKGKLGGELSLGEYVHRQWTCNRSFFKKHSK